MRKTVTIFASVVMLLVATNCDKDDACLGGLVGVAAIGALAEEDENDSSADTWQTLQLLENSQAESSGEGGTGGSTYDCDGVQEQFSEADFQCGTYCAAACSYASINSTQGVNANCNLFTSATFCQHLDCSYCN